MSYAKDVLRGGMPRGAVEEVLRAQGFEAEAARALVDRADRAKSEKRVAGRRHMIMGAFVCAVGITVTAVSYFGAAPGGTYLVAVGAILVGAIQCFRGLVQMTDK